jgi:hypothetical protein
MQGQCGEVTEMTDASVVTPCSWRLESVTVIPPPMWSLLGRSQLVASQGHQIQGTYLLWEHCAERLRDEYYERAGRVHFSGRLAQLVRAAGLQPAGRGFESLSAHSVMSRDTLDRCRGTSWTLAGLLSRSERLVDPSGVQGEATNQGPIGGHDPDVAVGHQSRPDDTGNKPQPRSDPDATIAAADTPDDPTERLGVFARYSTRPGEARPHSGQG